VFRRGDLQRFIQEMGDYEKKEAAIKLIMELEKGRISGDKEGWHTLEELRQEFGIYHTVLFSASS
jgi:hypothetical protein